jgi:hypothetical protein
MRDEVIRLHKAPIEKMNVIPPESAAWMKGILAVYKNTAEAGVS